MAAHATRAAPTRAQAACAGPSRACLSVAVSAWPTWPASPARLARLARRREQARAHRVRRLRIDGADQMDLCESNRVVAGLDIWVIEGFAQEKLNCDPAKLQKDLEDKYPVRGKGDAIAWGEPQWVKGDNEALHYRGRELKRGKMWFQLGEPQTDGFVKYYYTGPERRYHSRGVPRVGWESFREGVVTLRF